MADNLMLLLCNSFNSLVMVFTSNCINAVTSNFGLFQFSVEKAYSVRCFTPISAAPSTTLFTEVTPFLCPKTLGCLCCFAHLPLPSIIMAMCLGILLVSKFMLFMGVLKLARGKYNNH